MAEAHDGAKLLTHLMAERQKTTIKQTTLTTATKTSSADPTILFKGMWACSQ
jgi:hypothetical protein